MCPPLRRARRDSDTTRVVFGKRGHFARVFSGRVTFLKWRPQSSPSLAPPTRWSLLCLVTATTLKIGSLPLPGMHFYLMTLEEDHLHIHTHSHTHSHRRTQTHTLASVCWHLTPHVDEGRMKGEFCHRQKWIDFCENNSPQVELVKFTVICCLCKRM